MGWYRPYLGLGKWGEGYYSIGNSFRVLPSKTKNQTSADVKRATHFIGVSDGPDLEVNVELGSEHLPLLHQHLH